MSDFDSTKEFLQYFAQHHRQIYAFIRAQVRCTSDANDLLQETSVLLWEKFHDFDRNGDFGRWACGFARRLILRHYRETGKFQTLFGETIDQQFTDQLLISLQVDDKRGDALGHCLKELDERQRKLLDMRYQSEQEVSDIAATMDRSESAVYKALAKIHERLYECIQQKLAEWGGA